MTAENMEFILAAVYLYSCYYIIILSLVYYKP